MATKAAPHPSDDRLGTCEEPSASQPPAVAAGIRGGPLADIREPAPPESPFSSSVMQGDGDEDASEAEEERLSECAGGRDSLDALRATESLNMEVAGVGVPGPEGGWDRMARLASARYSPNDAGAEATGGKTRRAASSPDAQGPRPSPFAAPELQTNPRTPPPQPPTRAQQTVRELAPDDSSKLGQELQSLTEDEMSMYVQLTEELVSEGLMAPDAASGLLDKINSLSLGASGLPPGIEAAVVAAAATQRRGDSVTSLQGAPLAGGSKARVTGAQRPPTRAIMDAGRPRGGGAPLRASGSFEGPPSVSSPFSGHASVPEQFSPRPHASGASAGSEAELAGVVERLHKMVPKNVTLQQYDSYGLLDIVHRGRLPERGSGGVVSGTAASAPPTCKVPPATKGGYAVAHGSDKAHLPPGAKEDVSAGLMGIVE